MARSGGNKRKRVTTAFPSDWMKCRKSQSLCYKIKANAGLDYQPLLDKASRAPLPNSLFSGRKVNQTRVSGWNGPWANAFFITILLLMFCQVFLFFIIVTVFYWIFLFHSKPKSGNYNCWVHTSNSESVTRIYRSIVAIYAFNWWLDFRVGVCPKVRLRSSIFRGFFSIS